MKQLRSNLFIFALALAGTLAHAAEPAKTAPVLGSPETTKPAAGVYQHVWLELQARFALACAKQAQRTGSALWRAKAEALAGAVVISQFPNSGQIPSFPNIGPRWPYSVGPGIGVGGLSGNMPRWNSRNLRS